MPHSSGGGSHGGGSHYSGGSSGGYRSSSGSSGSSVDVVKVSRKPYNGCVKYVYYSRGGTLRYIYADRKPSKPDLGVTIVIALILGFIALGIAWTLLEVGLYMPKALEVSSYASGIMIEDEVGVINEEDEDELEQALEAFLDNTGVSPTVKIVYNDTWDDDYDSLEIYAYSEYLRMYDDEKHWLVVISLPEDYETMDFVDWQWEGMIGDDCYPAISTDMENRFTDTVHKHMLRSCVDDIGENLADAYMEFNGFCMEMDISYGFVIAAGILVLMYLAILWFMINEHIKESVCYKAVAVPHNALEENCEYCGNLYIHGTVLDCPKCGAPIKAKITQ